MGAEASCAQLSTAVVYPSSALLHSTMPHGVLGPGCNHVLLFEVCDELVIACPGPTTLLQITLLLLVERGLQLIPKDEIRCQYVYLPSSQIVDLPMIMHTDPICPVRWGSSHVRMNLVPFGSIICKGNSSPVGTTLVYRLCRSR
jgi:hypothetical protein